ncbi:MAG TPA: efflux RND transporter periplasmic adaptor subunit [Pirellulales bacterium]|nr:efflux RND transporter periplasmic adaptor subunit [Pirellulales bacterium]
MRSFGWNSTAGRHKAPAWLLGCRAGLGIAGLLAALTLPGCSHKHKAEAVTVSSAPPEVRIIQPQRHNIVRVVGQPSFVETYERTSIYPKLTGYVKKWYVDIGDRVKSGQVLADLFVPEIEEDCETKKATVTLDEQRVELAKQTVAVATANVKAAEAHLKSAKAIWGQYDAQAVRWDSEVKRLGREVKRGVVDAQVLLESENQFRASSSARDAAEAEIVKAEADLESQTATLHEDEVAVRVADANVKVATSDWKRMQAWVGYLKLYAPFDGVVVSRNANTGDFVLPATGDPSADMRSPNLSPSGTAAPVYVIDRTDVVRVFVDIPEHDANYVHVGTKARVLAKAFRDQPVLGTVTRTSWALNVKSRTLRAEIDLPNTGSKIPDDLPPATREALAQVKLPSTDSQILPGMYAYGKVIIERPNALAVPVSALSHSGEKAFYWSYENGKAVRTEVQTGVSDGQWIEVTNRRIRPQDSVIEKVSFVPNAAPQEDSSALDGDEHWVPFDGSERVILGDLSILTDGGQVQLLSEQGTTLPAGINEAAKTSALPPMM